MPFEVTRELFDDIAIRMREIAYCLDVTDRLAPDFETTLGPPGPLLTMEGSSGCAPEEIS